MHKWGMTCAVLLLSASAHAFDYNEALKDLFGNPDAAKTPTASTASPTRVENLKPAEIALGLKEALVRGSEIAVAQLGQKDGFFGNAALKIPLPANLKKAEKAMRLLGMGQQTDDLVLSMNRAAEAAVPEAKTLLVGAVKAMSVEDARGILMGGSTAATDFFRNKTETILTERFLPIVKSTTDQSSMAQQYNNYAGMAAQFGVGKKGPATVEGYVTQQALDRLYQVIAEQERSIRANPLQASSDLMKKVFGAAMGQ